jgi:hypothetical protein
LFVITNITLAFNPKTLRIAELRKILIFHEIDFVTGAKKGDLVEAFQKGIVPQRAKLLREVAKNISPSATRSSNPIQNASLTSSTKRRSRLNDESPPARKTRQEQPSESAIFDDESKPAKISPNRRRHRSLAKPFVDPGNIEDNATPTSEEKVTPVKTITPRPNRRRSSSFSKSARKELNLDHLSASAEKKLDSDAKPASGEAERRERIDKSPFSNVNFFQSASPDPKPGIKKEKRKRQHNDEPHSVRKKRELEESIKQESLATPTKTSHTQINATNSDSKSYKGHDTTFRTATENRTPKRSSELKQPPHTDPAKGSARSGRFVDATYSVGKKQPGLFHPPGAGRKLSFMPDFDQLNVSKEFSKQLINSTPIKFEKKLDTADKEEKDLSEEEDIEMIPSDDDEVDLSDDKENSSELSSSGDEEDYVDQSETMPGKSPLFQTICILVFFILGTALARWWIIERINAGYCDVGFVNWKPHYSRFTPTKLSDYFDPEYIRDRGSQVLDYIRPDCQNCPAHAKCYRGFKAVCDPGFVKKQSLLGHFLPIRPTCEPDTQKQRRVKAIANKALEILAQRNVDFQCGKYKGENGFDACELHDAIYKLTSASLDEDEFHDLWASAVADIENHDDITVSATIL